MRARKISRLLSLGSLLFGLFLASCGDDAASTQDAGADAGPDSGAPKPCAEDAECDDGLFCTGTESCVEGACVYGEPIVCNDGIACTVDVCSERRRQCEYLPPDADGDGHYAMGCADADGVELGDDCDDDDPLRFPGNIEFCDPDHHDEDCDPATFGDKDTDGDGFLDQACCNRQSDDDDAELVCGNDCDDLKGAVNPEAVEACDLFDNDCDGDTDEGVTVPQYPDRDFDRHGDNDSQAVDLCPGTPGYASAQNDCDDDDPEVFVGQFEICDGKDNNCVGGADEIRQSAPWFADVDEDGFGDPSSTPIYSCERIAGRVLSNSDCNDDNAAIHPAAAELCDAVDNNCDGRKDFRLGVNDFEDDDDDGVADDACEGGGDCNDTDSSTARGNEEICDQLDNDCDDAVDEKTAETVWFLDRDGDGWGRRQGTALARCQPIPGRSAKLGDCDDDNVSAYPGASESCNGDDDDCDGDTDELTDTQCSLDHALAICKLGQCAVLSCSPGFGDCNGDDSDGCECEEDAAPIDESPCTTDADCQDDDYCNGAEQCNPSDGLCYAGTPVNCTVSKTLLQGSYVIRNSLDIAALAGVETITGDLIIAANGLLNLTGLESLRTIGGSLIVDGAYYDFDEPSNRQLVALVGSGLSNLTYVGGNVDIQNNRALIELRLPSLVTAGGIFVRNNPRLVRITGMARLVRLQGDFVVENNELLTTISSPVLETVLRGLRVRTNPALVEVELPRLAQLGSGNDASALAFTDNDVLPTLARVGARSITCLGEHCDVNISYNLSLCSAGTFLGRLVGFSINNFDDNRISGCADTASMIGPRVRTFDGFGYAFNAVGEFTLVASNTDSLEVQIRTAPLGRNDNAIAVVNRVAIDVDGNHFEYALDGSMRVDGQSVSPNQFLFLDNGGWIEVDEHELTVHWTDGSIVRLVRHTRFIQIEAALVGSRSGALTGLFSNWNGSVGSELLSRDGIAIGDDAPFFTFYDLFAESWRISNDGSLFAYGVEEDTNSHTLRGFPSAVIHLDDLADEDRNTAAAACNAAQVTDPYWLEACTVDVAIFGDTSLAALFALLAPLSADLPTVDPPTTSILGDFPPFSVEAADTTALAVVQTIPATPPVGGNGTPSTNIDTRPTIVIYFDDQLNPASVTDESFLVTAEGVQYSGVFSATASESGNTILFFRPFRTLPLDTLVTVTLPAGGLRDDGPDGGNALAATHTFSFYTVGAGTPPPDSLSYEGAQGAEGWVFSGDGQVISSPQGPVSAPNGTQMAVISTGTLYSGAANTGRTSTLASGPISVPASAQRVLVDYDFISFEFDEYVGNIYDDFLAVTVSGPLGISSITLASVNSVGIDDSIAVSIPGLEGAQHTGFRTAMIDITQLGSPITLTFNISDVGDDSFDSAAFIDNIRFQ